MREIGAGSTGPIAFAPVLSPTSAAISDGSGSAMVEINDGVTTLSVFGTWVVVIKFCPTFVLPQFAEAASFEVAVTT